MSNGEHANRLTKIETKFDIWCKAHDVRSNDQWTYIKEGIDDLRNRMKCEAHSQVIKDLSTRMTWVFSIIGIMFVSVIIHMVTQ